LLKTKIKIKPIFKRDRKPTENNENNENNEKVKSIPKRKRKLIKINIYFYRNIIISISLIIIIIIIIIIFNNRGIFLIFSFSFFGNLFIYYIIVSAFFIIKYVVIRAFDFDFGFFSRRFNFYIIFIIFIVFLIFFLLIVVIVFKRGLNIVKYNKIIFKTGYKYVLIFVFNGVFGKEKCFDKSKYD